MPNTRLDKLIASQLNISRKDARIGIRRGQAAVNSETVKNPEFSVDPERDYVFITDRLFVISSIYTLL